jgi:O-antigen/teichoic acid export membrane protein
MLKKIKSFLFVNASEKQTVAKNTFWLTAGTVVSKTIRAILIIYSARVLGAAGYGIYSYVLSLAGFFTAFSDIGLTPLLTREAVKRPERVSAYISTTFILKIAVIIATVIVTVFAAPLFVKIDAAKALIPIVALILALDSLRNFGFSITRAQNRMEAEAFLNVATDVSVVALGVFVLFTAPTAYNLSLAYAAGLGLGLIYAIFAIGRHFKEAFGAFDRTLVKPILYAGLPFAIMGLLGSFMINIDTVVIGIFRTATDLGLYGVAQRPVQLLYIFPQLISTSLFPILSKLIRGNETERIKRMLERSIVAVMALALPLTIGGIILAPAIVQLFFGADYAGAVLAFQLLLLTLVTVFPGNIIGNAIFAYDEQKVFIISTLGGALINTGLDLVLIPAYGIAGSAVATIFSQFVANGVMWWKMQKINRLSFRGRFWKMGGASVLMGLCVFGLNASGANAIVSIAIGIGVYFGALYLLKEPLLAYLNPKGLIV